MRKLYIMCFTLIVLISTAMSAQALESKTIERQSGSSAYANWYETNGDVTTYTYLSLTETKDGTDIYVSTYTYGPDYWSEKSGYMFTEDDVFSINKKLNSASLSEIELEVFDWNTGEMDAVTVRADWTGTGEISTGSSNSKSKTGDYVWRSSENSKYRGASAIGSINGLDLGISPDAGMSNFKSAYMSMEK